MQNKPNPNDVIWDENAIEWDQPNPPEAQKKEQAGFDFPLAVTNLTEGAWGKLKDLVSPQTYIGLLELAKTGAAVTQPLLLTESYLRGEDPVGKVFQVGKSIVDDLVVKYGSWEKAKSTFQNTPIEPVLDLSMILTGGGTALTGKAGWLGKLGKVAQTTGMATDPFNIVTAIPKGISMFASPVTNRVTNRIYRSAAKIGQANPDLDLNELRRTAHRGLEDGVWMSESSLKEARKNMDNIERGLNSALDDATKQGKYVDSWRMVDEVDKIKQMHGKDARILPIPGLDNQLDDLKQIMLDAHGERITPHMAQQIKKGSYKILENAYDKISVLAKEAEKYATHSVMKQIEEMHPQIKLLNPKMQEYVWLTNSVEKVVRRAMEGPMMEGLSAYNAIARRTVDNPLLKSRLAIALHKANKIKRFSPTTTLGREVVYKFENINDGNIP